MNYHAPFNHGYSGFDEDPKIAFAHEINFECRSRVQNMIRHHVANVFWDIAKEFDRSFIVRYPPAEPQPQPHEETAQQQYQEQEQHQHSHSYDTQPQATSPSDEQRFCEYEENLPPIPLIVNSPGARSRSDLNNPPTPSDDGLPSAQGVPYRSPQPSPPLSRKPPLSEMNRSNRPVSGQQPGPSRPRRTTVSREPGSQRTRPTGRDENIDHPMSSIGTNRVILVKDVMKLMRKFSHQMNGCQKILQSIPVGSINKSLRDTCREISVSFSGINHLPVDERYVLQLKVLDERLDKLYKELKETEWDTQRVQHGRANRGHGTREDSDFRNSESSLGRDTDTSFSFGLPQPGGYLSHWEQKKDLVSLKDSILQSIGKCQGTLKFIPGQEIVDFRSRLKDISDLLSQIMLEERYRFELELLDGRLSYVSKRLRRLGAIEDIHVFLRDTIHPRITLWIRNLKSPRVKVRQGIFTE